MKAWPTLTIKVYINKNSKNNRETRINYFVVLGKSNPGHQCSTTKLYAPIPSEFLKFLDINPLTY